MLKKFQEFLNESVKSSEAYQDVKAIGDLMDKFDADLAYQDKDTFTLTFEFDPNKKKLDEVLAFINSKAKHYKYTLDGKVEEYPGEDGETKTKFVQDLKATV